MSVCETAFSGRKREKERVHDVEEGIRKRSRQTTKREIVDRVAKMQRGWRHARAVRPSIDKFLRQGRGATTIRADVAKRFFLANTSNELHTSERWERKRWKGVVSLLVALYAVSRPSFRKGQIYLYSLSLFLVKREDRPYHRSVIRTNTVNVLVVTECLACRLIIPSLVV